MTGLKNSAPAGPNEEDVRRYEDYLKSLIPFLGATQKKDPRTFGDLMRQMYEEADKRGIDYGVATKLLGTIVDYPPLIEKAEEIGAQIETSDGARHAVSRITAENLEEITRLLASNGAFLKNNDGSSLPARKKTSGVSANGNGNGNGNGHHAPGTNGNGKPKSNLDSVVPVEPLPKVEKSWLDELSEEIDPKGIQSALEKITTYFNKSEHTPEESSSMHQIVKKYVRPEKHAEFYALVDRKDISSFNVDLYAPVAALQDEVGTYGLTMEEDHSIEEFTKKEAKKQVDAIFASKFDKDLDHANTRKIISIIQKITSRIERGPLLSSARKLTSMRKKEVSEFHKQLLAEIDKMFIYDVTVEDAPYIIAQLQNNADAVTIEDRRSLVRIINRLVPKDQREAMKKDLETLSGDTLRTRMTDIARVAGLPEVEKQSVVTPAPTVVATSPVQTATAAAADTTDVVNLPEMTPQYAMDVLRRYAKTHTTEDLQEVQRIIVSYVPEDQREALSADLADLQSVQIDDVVPGKVTLKERLQQILTHVMKKEKNTDAVAATPKKPKTDKMVDSMTPDEEKAFVLRCLKDFSFNPDLDEDDVMRELIYQIIRKRLPAEIQDEYIKRVKEHDRTEELADELIHAIDNPTIDIVQSSDVILLPDLTPKDVVQKINNYNIRRTPEDLLGVHQVIVQFAPEAEQDALKKDLETLDGKALEKRLRQIARFTGLKVAPEPQTQAKKSKVDTNAQSSPAASNIEVVPPVVLADGALSPYSQEAAPISYTSTSSGPESVTVTGYVPPTPEVVPDREEPNMVVRSPELNPAEAAAYYNVQQVKVSQGGIPQDKVEVRGSAEATQPADPFYTNTSSPSMNTSNSSDSSEGSSKKKTHVDSDTKLDSDTDSGDQTFYTDTEGNSKQGGFPDSSGDTQSDTQQKTKEDRETEQEATIEKLKRTIRRLRRSRIVNINKVGGGADSGTNGVPHPSKNGTTYANNGSTHANHGSNGTRNVTPEPDYFKRFDDLIKLFEKQPKPMSEEQMADLMQKILTAAAAIPRARSAEDQAEFDALREELKTMQTSMKDAIDALTAAHLQEKQASEAKMGDLKTELDKTKAEMKKVTSGDTKASGKTGKSGGVATPSYKGMKAKDVFRQTDAHVASHLKLFMGYEEEPAPVVPAPPAAVEVEKKEVKDEKKDEKGKKDDKKAA